MGTLDHDSLFYANVSTTLSVDTYDAVYERMVNQNTHSDDTYLRSGLLSFTDQMARVTKASDPDYFLFTANSAIPVADAVRGYYEQIKRPCPLLGYVDVKSSLQDETSEVLQAHVTREATRLKPIIGGLGRVAVIDQFVQSGFSIDVVRRIISDTGARTSEPIRGNWYHDARPEDVDIANVTSTHADFDSMNVLRTVNCSCSYGV